MSAVAPCLCHLGITGVKSLGSGSEVCYTTADTRGKRAFTDKAASGGKSSVGDVDVAGLTQTLTWLNYYSYYWLAD